MNNRQLNAPPKANFSVGDIYHILFRHKLKILFLSLLGIGGAAAFYQYAPIPYQSDAKLFIRYVVEEKSPGQIEGTDARIKTTDQRGENIINTEIEILTSLDLAQAVAEKIGPERILGKNAQRLDKFAAGDKIRLGLGVEAPRRSDVIGLSFKHKDPEVAREVLDQLIASYLERHAEIHRASSKINDFLMKERDSLKSNLRTTETELLRERTNNNIVSFTEGKRLTSEQIARVRQSIWDAEAALAEKTAAVKVLSAIANQTADVSTNLGPLTNIVIATAPAEIENEYVRVSKQLDDARNEEVMLLRQFTVESPMVKRVMEKIAQTETRKVELEKAYPALIKVQRALEEAKNPGTPAVAQRQVDLGLEQAQVAALESRINVLKAQLEGLTLQARRYDELELKIADLERTKERQEENYKMFDRSYEQAALRSRFTSDRVSNISTIQNPSQAYKDPRPVYKVMAGLAFGGIALALALAFVLEMYVDRSLKRDVDIESKLGMDLFLTIPKLSRNGAASLNGHNHKQLEYKNGSENGKSDAQLVKWDPRHVLSDFHDALRDRIMTFFELKNMTHKPKLVAITSCGAGSGVSTTAAGLAASFSETGDGNVLLVDMNEEGAAHHFYKGKLACGLDDALQLESRENALVQENLYVVSEAANAAKLPRVMPKRFTHIVPKLKTSDYDYIIFDMPPVSQISITPRLAKFMDMVVLVVESERTSSEVVKKASILLRQTQPNIGVVLNKSRSYVPRMLKEDI